MSKPFLIDASPIYDLLQAMALVAQPPQGQDRWDVWAREAAAAMESDRAQQLARWFNDEWPLGTACAALVPTITGEHTIPAFLDALAHLPVPDFLRLMVTCGELTISPPLAASDLLALVGNRRAAQAYVDRYLGLTGRVRTSLIHLVAEPEEARRELLELFGVFAETIFASIEPSLREERDAAGEALAKAAYRLPDAVPEWLSWTGDYSPAVLAPCVMLADRVVTYYHELDRSLFDSMRYEPLVSMVGTRRILASSGHARRSGRLRLPALPSPDPVDRWAQAYTALGDPSRLRIVRLLLERPRYGQELATLLNISGATISHHIGELSKAGILRLERRGQRTYFHIQSEALLALLDESRRYLFETASDPTPENPKDEATP
ncbi:MAG TPA: metalloregulator ArsR/SmtB family transcription factor [Ktedonobacterales bacterium]|nr:metalloregulator ArsR/SmtB family transcription factor [Ktedonobacterales bacterium]